MAEITMTRAAAAVTAPVVRRIGVADVRAAWSAGLTDFLAVPTQLVFLCILYPIVGLVAARATVGTGLMPLLFPLVAGISLLGPVMAVGLYEISRRREAGLSATWLNALDVLRSPAIFSIAVVGIVLLVAFTAWLGAAKLVYELTIGETPATSVGGFAHLVFATPAGWTLIVVGNLVGLAFAVAVLMLTVVSVPMLLDRNVSPIVAIQTSVRTVQANPGPMALWGLIVAAALLAGCIPLFIGLAVVMPILGHATWHLYRRVVV
jgi:uncharacterized membrane protein